MSREAIVLLMYPSHGTYFISEKSSWFGRFITDATGDFHDCYLASDDDEFTTVAVPGETLKRSHCTNWMSHVWKIQSTGMQRVPFGLWGVRFPLY